MVVIVAREQPHQNHVVYAAQGNRQGIVHSAADRAAILELVLLVAGNGIDQVVREVVPQMQLIIDDEGAGRELSGA